MSTGYDKGDTKIRNAGNTLAFWALNAIPTLMDANRRLCTLYTEKCYDDEDGQRRYFRFTGIPSKDIELDDYK